MVQKATAVSAVEDEKRRAFGQQKLVVSVCPCI